VVGGLLLLLAADHYVLTPFLDSRAALQKQRESLQLKLDNAQRLFDNRAKIEAEWRGLLASGLKTDPGAGENQALHALRDSAQTARVTLASLKPDHTGRTGDFLQIRVQATGSGSMAQISELLWLIESTKLPLRVLDVRITSRKEGTDDLSFAITTATVVFSPAPEKPKRTTKGASR
jgi:hypothetical protein